MMQEKQLSGDLRTELGVSAALAVLTLLVYWPSFRYPFINYDDPPYVSENAQVQAGLTADGVRWAFTTFACGYWQPLTWLSLQLDSTIYGGGNAGGFHRTNVLLHTANALLLFLVLHRMTGARGCSAFAASLFALHPLHVESVAWVTERKDVLSTFFGMLTLAAYIHYVKRPNPLRYIPVALALALGLMAKPMLVTLPCVLLLLDYWPLQRGRSMTDFRHLTWEKLPLFALVLASCILTVLTQQHGKAVAPLEKFPFSARLGNGLLSYTAYLGKMLWPAHLAVYYPHPGASVSILPAVAAGLLLAIITGLVLGPGRRRPYLAVGWLWYLGTLVPMIGLVQVGSQGMADRFTYVPLIGLYVMLSWGAADLLAARQVPLSYARAIAVGILCVCAVLTRMQLRHWSSSLDLWKHTAAVTEKNVLAHLNLGVCYQERGMLSDARREYEKAVQIDPSVAEPHVNLGIVLAELGRKEQAMAELRQAIDLAPELSGPHYNLGGVLAELGRPEEAIAEYRRAIDLAPTDPRPHNNLAVQLVSLGQWPEAEAEYHAALALDSGNASVHGNLGLLLAEMGRLEEAAGEQRKSLELGDKQALLRLRSCERLLALRPRLAGLITGRDQPANNAERLAFAELCRLPSERHYALAARLFGEAFRTDPALVEDRRSGNRFHAAATAAAAGCGQGAAVVDEKEKARLRHQARVWLQAELDGWIKQAQNPDPQARAAVGQVMRRWQRDPRLAGVRDAASLEKLPDGERQAWRNLWREVGRVLARTSPPQKEDSSASHR